MSAHPFQRMFRNGAALLLAIPVRDGSTRVGLALARASRATMYPEDRQRMEIEEKFNDFFGLPSSGLPRG